MPEEIIKPLYMDGFITCFIATNNDTVYYKIVQNHNKNAYTIGPRLREVVNDSKLTKEQKETLTNHFWPKKQTDA